MSVRALTWAFEQPFGGNEKVVLLALADWARDDGLCWPGQESIARKAYVSPKTVARILDRLEARGALRREHRSGTGGGRQTDLIWLAVKMTVGANGQTEGGQPDTHAPAGREPSEEPSGSLVRGRAVSYQGRRVPPATVAAAETLLAVFNEAEGRDLGAWTGSGKASPSLKQIIGALLSRDHVTVVEWERAVRAVSANPPDWCDGTLQLGHIFGERAADYALANNGTRRVNGKKAGPGMSDFAQIAMGTDG